MEASTEKLLRDYLRTLQNNLNTNTIESVIDFLQEPLDFLENGTSWHGPASSPETQKYFITKLYSKQLKFLIDNIIINWFETLLRKQKDMLVMEYFVPKGTKNLQKIKRASISLQVLVSYFSTSYQSQNDLKPYQKRQTYLATIIQKFIFSLMRNYSIQDFFDAILKNEDFDIRERYSEWKEFVGLICSIPERSANLMAFNQNLESREEFRFLSEAFHHSTPNIYYKIWKIMISSFSSHVAESFLTAFLLHSQSQDLSKITNPVSNDDKSRYLVRKVATLLSLLIGKDNNENVTYLIKFKYFVGGKIFPISIVRVFICFLSWDGSQDRPDDMMQKFTGQIDNLKLGPNDDLTLLLKTLISSWSDPTFTKHASSSMQMYITSAILIIFGYLPKSTLVKVAILRDITPGITRWLQSTSEEARKLGMITAEIFSKLTDVSENVLDFELNPEDDDVKYLRQLAELKDGIVDLPDIYYEDKLEAYLNEEKILDESSYYEDKVKSEGLVEIKNVRDVDETRVVDSDDEDDFASDDPDKLEVAMNVAKNLIRQKTGFGTELDDHAMELAKDLIGLQDNYELKGFEENRHAAMIALICGSPKIAVPFIIQQFFEKKYSLAERYMILSTLSTGARELAGLQDNKSIEDKKEKETAIMDTLSQEISKLDLTNIRTLKETSNEKVRRFSRKPLVESTRTTSVNRFNELAAKTFFFPLTAGFWNLTRDRDLGNFMKDPTLIQRYVTTLGVFVQCSVNTIALSQITREYWDLILSLRFFDDLAVLTSILFGINVILNTSSEKELAESYGKELIETNQWVTTIFENKMNEQAQSMAAWVLVKIKGIVTAYQRLLMEDLLPLT
ncbi:11878_t:CDS:10 [Funneliformis geosporum]|uniref:14541_t:CDS:1 n=1 Tax=Funneliformis geosporum TaxID=1117311 RepID=A0A9W4WXP6_9GLOM|nr:11878_t:CDS:10 [Funneliformis geosporum]CAI2179968.1 14541_t:CDS:10 [Funneliformis geosporum]